MADGGEGEDLELTADDAAELAESVRRIDEAMGHLAKSGLNRVALITLLAHSTKVRRGDIQRVLDGLSSLGERYLEAAEEEDES